MDQHLCACNGSRYFRLPKLLEGPCLQAPQHRLDEGRGCCDCNQCISGPSEILMGSLDEPKNEERDGHFYGPKGKRGEENGQLAQHDYSACSLVCEKLKVTAKAGFHRLELDNVARQIECLQTLVH